MASATSPILPSLPFLFYVRIRGQKLKDTCESHSLGTQAHQKTEVIIRYRTVSLCTPYHYSFQQSWSMTENHN